MADISSDTRCDFRYSVGNTGLKLVWKRTLFESHSIITKQTNKQTNKQNSKGQCGPEPEKGPEKCKSKTPQGLVEPWSVVVRRGSICRDNINIMYGSLGIFFSQDRTLKFHTPRKNTYQKFP